MDKRIHELLLKLRGCPGIYVGKKSLDKLATFVCGYVQCLSEIDGVEPVFLAGFQEYVEEYYHLNDNAYLIRNWTGIITFFSTTEEEAFDKFYEILGQFLSQ